MLKPFILFVCTMAIVQLNQIRSFPVSLSKNLDSGELTEDKPDTGQSTRPGAAALLPFLKKFGYLESGNSSNQESETLYTKESIEEAIREMQRFGAIPETGELDKDTIKLLTKPRCGLPDVIREETGSGSRKKRFVIGAKGWNKRRLTYRIENWAPELEVSSVMEEMKKAFSVWADYARLRFVDKPRWNYDDVDISISFGRGHHGDRYPFDGAGGVLAHAFFPYGHGSLGGDIHFDVDESWRSNTNGSTSDPSSVSFFAVAVHEIGHSLGLAHSPSQDSVMFPYYQYYEDGAGEKVRLGYDDIMAMYQLYIQRSIEDLPDESQTSTTRPTVTTREPEAPTSPSTRRYTSSEYPTRASTVRTTTIYPIPTSSSTERYNYPTNPSTTGSTIWIDTEGQSSSTELTQSTSFPTEKPTIVTNRPTRPYYYPSTRSTPSTTTYRSVSANQGSTGPEPELCRDGYDTIAYIRNEVFVFKNEYMWRFRTMGQKERGYPVKTSRLFPMLDEVSRIDAAFEDDSGKIYFFSGNKYWTFDENGRGSEQASYITDFSLPHQLNKIDGAFKWGKNGKTYFFSQNMFWRYDGLTERMDEGYPKGINRWRGLPGNGIDSVLKYSDGRTYFFKNNDFWRFDDTLVQTDEGFPLPTSEFWLGC